MASGHSTRVDQRRIAIVKRMNVSDKDHKLRMRRKLSVLSTSDLVNDPVELRTAMGNLKDNDNICANQKRKTAAVRVLKSSAKMLQKIKKRPDADKKKRVIKKKRVTTFQRWSQILCVRKKEPKKINVMGKPNKRNSEDSYSMESRELTVVRGNPCARNRMPCDRRKMRKIHLFDPCKDRPRGKRRSEAMLERAKLKAIAELNRQHSLGWFKPSPLEQAFLDASNENLLAFDYEWMKTLVRNARFADSDEQKRFSSDAEAYNDNISIILNSNMPFIESEICATLFHESLHNTVERTEKRGNPQLSGHIEHMAMALLGDREEQQEYFQRYFNLDYVNESWMKVHQRKKRRLNPKYLTNVYDYGPCC